MSFDPQKMLQEVLNEAERIGMRENYLFVATFADYQQQRKIMSALKKEIDKGVVINGKINPAVAEYNATAKASAIVAKSIKEMIYGSANIESAKIVEKEVNINECPDFSTLSPKQIMKWCKEFDIDPNDYSKQYLVKALTKRWKFKYED